MYITVADSLELDVRAGATAGTIAAFASARGCALDSGLWCGDVELDPDHPAGTWPLLHGARIAGAPGEPCAPPRGPSVVAVAGPDAGRVFGPAHRTVGRAAGGGRGIADDRLSRGHLELTATPALAARDAGSTNGSWLVRDGERRRRLARARPLQPGDRIAAGRTVLAYMPAGADAAAPEGASTAAAPTGLTPRLAPLAASAGGGVMMAALTGRWWFMLLGLVYPAIALGPELARRWAGSAEAAPPTPLDPQRATADWAGAACIVGAPHAAHGFARAVILGRGRRPPAGSWQEPWMRWLPPPRAGDGPVRVLARGGAASWEDAVATVSEDGVTWERAGTVVSLPPVCVAADAAEAWARRECGQAADEPLPSALTWGDVEPRPGRAARPGLRVPIGASAAGPLHLDLDAHGPHVLVAGTTGSGKSALLETLVLGLARQYGPEDAAVAILDFKGGAGLASCRELPHVCGILTDLEPHLARRALAALARELVARKEALAGAGHASIADWERAGGAPPRLVVVADEYQELAAGYPDFLPDLARLAAQGRSLGLHLVLATQRPSGAVTPEIRANIGTTVALRVASEAESRDLVGTADAATLPVDRPGRAVVATGQHRTQIQCALPTESPSPPVRIVGAPPAEPDARAFAAAAADGPRPAALWTPPLPTVLAGDAPELSQVGSGEAGFGRWDEPATRAQGTAAWRPDAGALAVIGSPGTGRTTALRAIAAGLERGGLRPVWLPRNAREAARTLALAAAAEDAVVIVDDADAALADLAVHARGSAADALSRAVAARRAAIAVGASSHSRLASACTARLVLGAIDPAEAAAWGVPRELAAIPVAPGRGRYGVASTWREVQVAHQERRVGKPLVHPLPASVAGALPDGAVGVGGDEAGPWRLSGGTRVVVVGDPSRERDQVERILADAGADCRAVDTPFALPPRERDGATVVVARPHEPAVRELAPESLAEVVEAGAPRLRVVVIDGDGARAVQLADVPGAGA